MNDSVGVPVNIHTASLCFRGLELHVDVLFLRVGEHFLEAFLAADAVACSRRTARRGNAWRLR